MSPKECYIMFGLMGYIQNGGGRRWGDPPDVNFQKLHTPQPSSTKSENSSSASVSNVYDPK